jgi:hypothetical protein
VEAVKVGAVPLVMVMLAVPAGVPTPLEADTVKVKLPLVVGVPERTPPVLSDSPVGTVPVPTEKVGAGLPEAVKV